MVHVMSEVKNPVFEYADQYRAEASRGQKLADIWSVVTDLERNIAPLWDAQRLRADTAEAERMAAIGEVEKYARDSIKISNALAAAEQRIAELKVMLRQAWVDECVSAEDCRKIDAALNPKPEPVKELWLGIDELPDHKEGALYRMILDDVPQVCKELDLHDGGKRWFYGEENGAFPEDEIQAWLPINPKPESAPAPYSALEESYDKAVLLLHKWINNNQPIAETIEFLNPEPEAESHE